MSVVGREGVTDVMAEISLSVYLICFFGGNEQR